MRLADRLEAAWQRRAALHAAAATTAYRLIHREADGFPDLAVDRYGDALVAHVYSQGAVVEPPAAVLRGLMERAGARSVHVKYRPVQANALDDERRAELAPAAPLLGEPVESVTALENGLRFEIRPGDGLSAGLFLDMRDARAYLRSAAAGATVLNCFAYTCGFGVAALAGGAARALNLDVSRRALDWGERNARLNGFEPARTDFVAGDAFDWLGRFARRGQRFDVVVLDPPSYSTTRETRFAIERDLPALVALAARATQPGGLLIACANHHQMTRRAFRARVMEGLAACQARVERALHEPGVDFPPAPGQEPYLKVLAVRLSPRG
jgi:23S rRNA (cytosine1962-C5)-methyltransferase